MTSADPNRYQAPFWSGVAVEAYQLEPLRRALSSPRANLLLADDVGLGKTIEAGLVVQELFLRHRARTAMIVCPPSLSLKCATCRDKFGLQFVIVNSELMAQVAYPRPASQPVPAVSAGDRIHGVAASGALSTPAARRVPAGQEPEAGCCSPSTQVIADEAPTMSPSSPSAVASGRGYSVDTQRTVAVRQLARSCEHRLFLSATPHNGYPVVSIALMEMIDPRRFARCAWTRPRLQRHYACACSSAI